MATIQGQEICPKVEAFLASGPLKGWVGGNGVEATDGQTFTTQDPGTGEVLAEVFSFQKADVDNAVRVADEAFKNSGWATMAVNERSAILHRLADAVESQIETISQLEALDCGKILEQARGDVQNFIDTMRYFADLSLNIERRTVLAVKNHEAAVVRHPWGPCGFIIPWNFPFLLLGWGIAPALAAGNTVVVKPAEDTPLSALYLAQLATEVGVPDGVINIVPGLGETAGKAVSENPGFCRMSFTGSPEVGRLVAAASGANLTPVKLELGGKGAAVVFDDCDMEFTTDGLVGAITFHTGQVCCDATRWLVHKNIYDEFVGKVKAKMEQVAIGHPLGSATQMGPVVSAKQRERVLGYLEKGVAGGADLILEGGAASVDGCDGGHYVKPALLAGSLDNVAAVEEIFGPVAYLAPFDSEEEGVRLANNTDYGLANSVWSQDLAKCQRVAESFESGNGWINSHNVIVHGVPYAGVKKSGMGGGVVSIETLLDYYRNISVIRPL